MREVVHFKKDPKILIRSAGAALLQRRVEFQFENTFFERSHFTMQDMLFIKQYLDGGTLLEASRQAGISYEKSGVDWASFIRELFNPFSAVVSVENNQ